MNDDNNDRQNLPPLPGGRKGKTNEVDRVRVRDLYLSGKVTEAARLMRTQGYTLQQIAGYVGLSLKRATSLVDDLPTPNMVDEAKYVAEARASQQTNAQQQAGVDRFERALAARDVEFFRGMDDLSACNRTNQRNDVLVRYHDPHKLHRCLAWLEKSWRSTDYTLHAKVLRRGPDPVPREWVEWWSAEMGIAVGDFDKSQVILNARWHPVDHSGATRGLLELRYRSRELTQNILGVWAAKRELLNKMGLSRISMADLVLGEL